MEKETRAGKVILDRGHYFLQVGDKRLSLEPGGVLSKDQLKELEGKEVEVLYTKPRQDVIGLASREFPPIFCYVPPRALCYYPKDDWIFKGIEEQVRLNLADEFFNEGIISEEVHAILRRVR